MIYQEECEMTEIDGDFFPAPYLELLLYKPTKEKATTFQWDSHIKNVRGKQ